MPAVSTRPTTLPSRLLRELASLPWESLDRLMPKIEALRLRKHPSVLPSREASLLKQVQRGLPARLRNELASLSARKDSGSLTSEDRKRLSGLASEIDSHQARHVQALIALAAIRRTTVPALARQLGLPRN